MKLNVLETLYDAIRIKKQQGFCFEIPKTVPYDVKAVGILFKNNEQLFLKASCLLIGLEIRFSHFWIQLD